MLLTTLKHIFGRTEQNDQVILVFSLGSCINKTIRQYNADLSHLRFLDPFVYYGVN